MTRGEAIAKSLAEASRFLEKVLKTPASDVQRAAAVKAFESAFELSWKLLQARLRDDGVQVATPRAAFRAAADAGLVGAATPWLTFLSARNLTSHTYNRAVAEEVYAVIAGGFLEQVNDLLDRLGYTKPPKQPGR